MARDIEAAKEGLGRSGGKTRPRTEDAASVLDAVNSVPARGTRTRHGRARAARRRHRPRPQRARRIQTRFGRGIHLARGARRRYRPRPQRARRIQTRLGRGIHLARGARRRRGRRVARGIRTRFGPFGRGIHLARLVGAGTRRERARRGITLAITTRFGVRIHLRKDVRRLDLWAGMTCDLQVVWVVKKGECVEVVRE